MSVDLTLRIENMTFTNKWIGKRIRNVLLEHNIETLDDLLGYSAEELLAFPRFGAISLAELTAKLEGMGLKLRHPGW